MNFVQLVLFLTFLNFCSCQFDENEKFKSSTSPKVLSIIFRHGARNPVGLIPNDPNNKVWEKTCLGELTDLGKKEQMLNGELTLKRYRRLFGDRYNCSTLYAQSSTIPRAVVSGSTFMAGVYQPQHDQVWTDKPIGKVWEPVPIYTTDIASGSLLALSFPTNTKTTSVYAKHKTALEAIANATGAPLDNYALLFTYTDALVCDAYHNYKIPFGLQKYKNEFTEIVGESLAIIVEPIRIKVTYILLSDALNRIDAFNNGQSSVNANIYSLHDAHVYAVMYTMTGIDIGQPPFSSTVYFELWEENSSQFIKLWYRAHLYSEPTPYAIKNCGLNCPLSQFRAIVNSLANQ